MFIKYVAETPEISIIKGISKGSFFNKALLWIVATFLIATFILIKHFVSKFKILNIIKYGEITKGKLVKKQFLKTFKSKRAMYKYTFEFKTKDGKLYQSTTKTVKKYEITAEKEEELLYNTKKPSKFMIFDRLPTKIREYFNENFIQPVK